MENAIFMTLVGYVIQAWGGRDLGLALCQWQAHKLGRPFVSNVLLGLLMGLGPFFILVPVWQIFGQPLYIIGEVVALVAAFVITAFVPEPLRARFIGPRTYWLWASLVLFISALYIVNQVWEDRMVMASCFFIRAFLALAYGVRIMMRRPAG